MSSITLLVKFIRVLFTIYINIIYIMYTVQSCHLQIAHCRLSIYPGTRRNQTLGVEVAGSILSAAEGLVVDDVTAGRLAAPSVVVVAVIAEGDLRGGRRAPASLNHDVGLELIVFDGALLFTRVRNEGETVIDREKKECNLHSSSCRSTAASRGGRCGQYRLGRGT